MPLSVLGRRSSQSAGHCLQRTAVAVGADTTPGLIARLLVYLELLVRWNRAVRLTGERDPTRVAERLLAPSLAAGPYVRGVRCADLGSGGGLPGIVLAIARPRTQWTLIDSNLKKTCFLRQVCIELALTNVEVVHGRIETYRQDRTFDTITARALGKLPQLLTLARPLAAHGARLLAWKGPGAAPELAELDRMAVMYHSHPIASSVRNQRLVEVFLAPQPICNNSRPPSSGPTHCLRSSQ